MSPWDASDKKNLVVECYGAGGGGGASDVMRNGYAGGGGGGGAYSKILIETPGASCAFKVGAGGTSGVNGGDTWFIAPSTCLAKGGYAGSDDSHGDGGKVTSGVGDVKYGGGSGYGGVFNGVGGGGGEGASSASNGTSATSQSGASGTAGGNGGMGGAIARNGLPALSGYGGGGGGAGSTNVEGYARSGGGGANGIIFLSWDVASASPSVSVSASNSPSLSPSVSSSISASNSPSASPSEGESPSNSPSMSPSDSSESPSNSPSNSYSLSPSESASLSPSAAPAKWVILFKGGTVAVASASESPSESPSSSPSVSPSVLISASESPSGSPSLSPSKSPSISASNSPSSSVSVSPSASASNSPSASPSSELDEETQVANLTEMITRRDRQNAAEWISSYTVGGTYWSWCLSYLENYSANPYYDASKPDYVFQPMSLKFNDAVTGRETWVMMKSPGTQTRTFTQGADHDQANWSYDGSVLAGYMIPASGQDYAIPSLKSAHPTWTGMTLSYNLFIVRSDGSYMRMLTGYNATQQNIGNFPFANTENALYLANSTDGKIYKTVFDSTNAVTSNTEIFNLATATGGSGDLGLATTSILPEKYSISNDDMKWLSHTGYQAWPRIVAEPTIAEDRKYGNGVLFLDLNKGVDVVIRAYYSLYRPVALYADSTLTRQRITHNGAMRYVDQANDYFVDMYESEGFLFHKVKCEGSDTDDGALWEEWDGSGYGANEWVPHSFAGSTGIPPGPYVKYWGHPSFDRWGKYVLHMAGDPNHGKVIVEWLNDNGFDGGYGFIDTALRTAGYTNGWNNVSYSNWRAWADAVVWEPDSLDATDRYHAMHYGLCTLIDFVNGEVKRTDEVYFIGTNGVAYSGGNGGGHIARNGHPAQSPDGTKVAYHNSLLNRSYSDDPTGSFTCLQWAVCYYPYPATITRAIKTRTNVRIVFDPTCYTTRGDPDELSDPPEPKEIKYWHVWYSTDKSTWTEATTTGVAFATRIYDYAQPNSSTYYYSITAEEHSRLESRRLGNIWKVITDGSGNITTQEEDTAMPEYPGDVSAFYTTAPTRPTGLTKDAPGYCAGHYVLAWTEPTDSKVRYYNIYYSTSGAPSATEAYRIASVPVGTSDYLDWCADKTLAGYYGITSVDRQGNESSIVQATEAP